MSKDRVLFVCVHNSARSQMAEAFLNEICPERFEAHSAGLEPGVINPVVVKAMREVGIDISDNETKSAFDLFKRGELFSYVITVCDEGAAEQCPIFPGMTKRVHWSFADPSAFEGDEEQVLKQTRKVRDEIRATIEHWCAEICELEQPILAAH